MLPDGAVRSEDNDLALPAFFQEQRRNGPVIYALWIADHISLLSTGFTSSILGSLVKEFCFFADDSFGGLVMQSAVKTLGAGVLSVSARDQASRLRSLRAIVQQRPSAFLAVDGGGPYFQVAPGLVSLARSIGCMIVPCSALTAPGVSMTNFRVSIAVPLPKSRIVITFGNAMDFWTVQPSLRPSEYAHRIEEALHAARQEGVTTLRERVP